MKIYLAARYDRRAELQGYARELAAAGHLVQSRWLHPDHDLPQGSSLGTQPPESFPMAGQVFAMEDREDVSRSDALIAFTQSACLPTPRGGCHVEFGLAVAMGKRLIVVGPRQNIFHTLPEVEQFDAWGRNVIAALDQMPAPHGLVQQFASLGAATQR